MLLTADATRAALPFERLIPALQEIFGSGMKVPRRHHHVIPRAGAADATLLLMPAWEHSGDYIGVKIVTVFPENSKKGLPGLTSSYLLYDGRTGVHLALLDGNEITTRRTVGVSALAASFLARPDAKTLLVVGAGRVASIAPLAFRTVRGIDRVEVWNVNASSAAKLVAQLRDDGIDAVISADLEVSVRRADIVCCASLSTEPLVRGDWLRPGTHLDLIGSFAPHMRETDDRCFRDASVFVDSPEAIQQSGDLISPIRNGVLAESAIAGTLAALCSGATEGRRSAGEITIFKAVGTGLADIAAGTLAYRESRDLPGNPEAS